MDTAQVRSRGLRYPHTVVLIASGHTGYRTAAKEFLEKNLGSTVLLVESVYEAMHVVQVELELTPVIVIAEEDINPDYKGTQFIAHVGQSRVFPLVSFLVHHEHDEEVFAKAKDAGAIECFALSGLPEGVPEFNLGDSFLSSIKNAEKLLRMQFSMRLDPLVSDIDKDVYVYNRIGVADHWERTWNEAKQLAAANIANSMPTCVFIDFVGFGAANTEKHKDGDRLVKEIAAVLCHNIRPTDYMLRYGGDEFVIVLPRTNVIDVREKVIPRLHQKLGETRFLLASGRQFPARFRAGLYAPPIKMLELSAVDAYEAIIDWANQKERQRKARQLKAA
jgi:diguanylate cyclase (GGDEF)-like protein